MLSIITRAGLAWDNFSLESGFGAPVDYAIRLRGGGDSGGKRARVRQRERAKETEPKEYGE